MGAVMFPRVPTLDELRALSDPELMEARTWIVDSMAGLTGSLQTSERSLYDDDWIRRAKGSLKYHERGLANIRNILQERATSGRFGAMLALARAVGRFLDEDSDENFEAMEAAYRTAWVKDDVPVVA